MTVSAVPTDRLTPRGADSMFSPPTTTKSGADATFRSPKPAKASNIRVVTRIRPLLEDEALAGRQVCIIPTPCENVTELEASQTEDENNEPALSPRHSQQTKFRPSNIQPPSSILPSSSMKSPSLIPPKSKSLLSPVPTKISTVTSTSLHAGQGSNTKKFDFDAVLGMEATQQQVYNTVVGDKILSDVFRGINFTIIAYGQTCSGKSHTMQGYHESGHDSSTQTEFDANGSENLFSIAENDGIIPRAIHDLFQGKMKFRSKGAVSIEMTYFEVYNDEVRDLLHTTDFQNLKILDQGDAGVFLEGLQSVPIESAQEAYEMMNFAAERRATGSTLLNIQSSRSHAICTLTVSIRPLEKSRKAEITQAKLTLVDLAGSERIKKSGVEGIQKQESITINKDLFVLGKVVAALSDQSRSLSKEKHVAYRDSKLTRLLRESLGGNCFTVMISCVSPTDADIEESINTLRYAERARSISNTIKRNVSQALLSPAQCEALTKENMRLKALVAKLQKRVNAEILRDSAGSLLDQEEESYMPITNPPKEIFRVDSHSTSSSFSPSNDEVVEEEKRARKPIWLHFQDLAKITKDVNIPVPVQSVVATGPSKEIELRQQCNSKHDHPNRCLSYEMSLLPCGTDDLLGDSQQIPMKEDAGNKEKTQKETELLRMQLKKLNEEHRSLEVSIAEQKQAVEDLFQQKAEAEKSLSARTQETKEESLKLENLKSEERKMNESMESCKEELKVLSLQKENTEAEVKNKHEELSAVADQVKDKGVEFKNLENAVNEKRTELQAIQETTKAEVDGQIARRNNLKEEADNLERLVSKLKQELDDYQLRKSCISKGSEAEVESLQLELTHAAKQRRQSERDQTMMSTQITCLQEKLSSLEEEKIQAQMEREKEAGRVAGLNSQLALETDRRRSLEEQLHFAHQDYDTMAENLNSKLEEMKDKLTKEAAMKRQLQQQVKVLQKEKSELSAEVRSLQVKQTKAEKEFAQDAALKLQLQVEVDTLNSEKTGIEAKLRAVMERHAAAEKETLELQQQVKILQSQNADLEAHIRSIEDKVTTESQKRDSNAPGSRPTVEVDSTLAVLANLVESPQSISYDYIKEKTTRILDLADAAIDNIDGNSTSTLSCSSSGTNFNPGKPSSMPPTTTATNEVSDAQPKPEKVQLTNLEVVQPVCTCSSNLFQEKADYVDFYCPLINVECVCGHAPPKSSKEVEQVNDPCALASILRPWQVEFLADEGIHDTSFFVRICSKQMPKLSRSLRKWRKSKNLPAIKTKSCGVALHIWARTCKSVLQSVRSQREQGIVPRRPEFLELSLTDANTGISSLGGH